MYVRTIRIFYLAYATTHTDRTIGHISQPEITRNKFLHNLYPFCHIHTILMAIFQV